MAIPEEIQKQVLAEATSATPNYDIDYGDERFGKVESDKSQALTQLEQTYGGMIGDADKYYNDQIQASKDWADKQAQIQQDNTDFAIEQIEQQKDQANKDYQREQSGAYVDWRKQSNQYGTEAEKMASAGLGNTGYSESSQVSMYNTYQNRVATARESYNRAVLNYNNAIKDAQLQNNAALAEIAYQSLQQQLELSLQGFQYKNQLILEQANKKTELDNIYYNRYQDVLDQMNKENAMAEEIRQYNETQKWQTEQAELDRQFTAAQAELERQFNAAQAELERNHDEEMLDAETEAQKELLEIQHQNDIAKLNQQLENEKALLQYQYDLQKGAVTIDPTDSGNTGGSGNTSKSSSGNTSSRNRYQNVTSTTTFHTYNDARNYVIWKGVPKSVAYPLTQSEWSRRKTSGSMTGIGGAAVMKCNTYSEYLTQWTKYVIDEYVNKKDNSNYKKTVAGRSRS